MKIKHFLSLLTAVLIISAFAPFSAFAANDYNDVRVIIPALDEISRSSTVSMTVGKEKDLTGFIQYRATIRETGHELWYLATAIDWQSSNPEIVTVNSKGIAVAHKAGMASITATAKDNSGKRHVQTVPVKVTLGNSGTVTNKFEIAEGAWLDLRQLAELQSGSKEIEWSSSNTSIASVDSEGLVLSHGIGSCTVTASYTDVNGAKKAIKYKIRATSGSLSDRTRQNTIALRAGEKIDVGKLFYRNYQDLPLALSQVSCASSDKDILTVSKLIVSAKSAGNGSVTISQTDRVDEEIHYKLTIVVK